MDWLKIFRGKRILGYLFFGVILLALITPGIVQAGLKNIDTDDGEVDEWLNSDGSEIIPVFITDPSDQASGYLDSEDILNAWVASGPEGGAEAEWIYFMVEMEDSPAMPNQYRKIGAYLDCDDDGNTNEDPGDMMILYDVYEDSGAVQNGDGSNLVPIENHPEYWQRAALPPPGSTDLKYVEWGIPLTYLDSSCLENPIFPGGTLIGFFTVETLEPPAIPIDQTEARAFDIPSVVHLSSFQIKADQNNWNWAYFLVGGLLLLVVSTGLVVLRRSNDK